MTTIDGNGAIHGNDGKFTGHTATPPGPGATLTANAVIPPGEDTVDGVARQPGFVEMLRTWDARTATEAQLNTARWWGIALYNALDGDDEYPAYEELEEAIDAFDERDDEDDAADLADDIVAAARKMTAKEATKVFEAGNGRYIRAYDGRAAATCSYCGAGFATTQIAYVHREEQCEVVEGMINAHHDEQAFMIAQESSADYARRLQSCGIAAQLHFLRAHGHTDEQIHELLDGLEPDEFEGELEEPIQEVANRVGMDVYNDGVDPEGVAYVVVRDLDAKRYATPEDLEADPERTHMPAWGSAITESDPLHRYVQAFEDEYGA